LLEKQQESFIQLHQQLIMAPAKRVTRLYIEPSPNLYLRHETRA